MAFRGAALWLWLGLAAGCGSTPVPTPPPEAGQDVVLSVDAALLARSWPMSFADEASLAPFAAQSGWVELVMKRDLKAAVEQLGPLGGLPEARAHAEAALMYRMAALVAAQSYLQTFGESPQDSDPDGKAHLLMVSAVLVGDLEKARAYKAQVPATKGPCASWSAPWQAWLGGEAVWPPDLSALPLTFPPQQAGVWPELPEGPSYSLHEKGDTNSEIAVGDPGALLALALWHEGVAKQAAAGHEAELALMLARYRLPVEPPVAFTEGLSTEFLFGSDFGTPEDGAFMGAVTGAEGAAAVDSYKDRSLIAAVAAASRVDGLVNPERALDVVGDVRDRLKVDLEIKAGSQQPSHRVFIRILTVGLIRQLALVAAVEGQEKVGGILRINAMERSEDEARCVVGLLSLAAWDAGNRYPMRGSDIIHSHSRRYPSLEVARFALDSLAIRVGRERGNVGGVGM